MQGVEQIVDQSTNGPRNSLTSPEKNIEEEGIIDDSILCEIHSFLFAFKTKTLGKMDSCSINRPITYSDKNISENRVKLC